MSPERVPRFLRKILRARGKEGVGSSPSGSAETAEVALLRQLVKEYRCERFVLDAGANDGVTISNSLPFVEAGWRAVLIEPAPAVFEKLKKHHGQRKNVTCLQLACSNKTGEAELHIGSDGDEGFLSSLSEANNEWFKVARGTQSVKVKTDTLTNILTERKAPRCPGLLLVDCEGMDYEVLQGLDFSRFHPTVIVTEEYEWEPKKHAAKYSLLIRNNYTLVQKVGCNTVWIDRAAKKC